MGSTGIGMRSESRAATATKAKTRLAPVAMQGLEVLALPVTMLPDRIIAMAESNPLLEINYDDPLFRYDELPSEQAYESALAAYDERRAAPLPRRIAGPVSTASAHEWDFSRIQDDCLETETLQAYLHFQATDAHLGPTDAAAMDALIENVTDDGYFEGDLGAIAYDAGVPFARVQELLELLQGFQPAGVGARDLSECLALQVDPKDPYRAPLLDLIENHLDDLAAGRMAALSRELGVSADDMALLKRIVLGMNPRPGSSFFQRPDARYVTPDIVVRRSGVDFTVEVSGAARDCLTLNAEYVAMMEQGGLMREARDYLSAKREEADRFLRNLEQRRVTLQRFGAFLVERQYKFFLAGGSQLSPLTMQQAADALDVHVSTISRTVQGKYVQTPWGTFPLKMFFTRALPRTTPAGVGLGAREGAAEVSAFDIKRMIEELIGQEDPAHPLSDAGICERLNERGIGIKRRTVAKYREQLGIEAQSKRRWARER